MQPETIMPDNNTDESRFVLHIAPTPFFSDRGCHIRIAGIVRCLAAMGFGNRVCTYHLGYDLDDIDTVRIKRIAAYTKTSAGPSIHKILADFRLLKVTMAQLRNSSPVALHSHLHEGVLIALIARLLTRRRAVPIVADMQGSLVGELDSYDFFAKVPFLKLPFKLLERFLLHSADTIVCSSDHALEKFRVEFPGSAHKMRLVQDGADKSPAFDPDQLDARRKQLGIDPEKLCVVYSGALLQSKGLDQLQELIAACEAHQDKIHFLIIGYPEEELKQFLKNRQLESLCTLTGRIEFKTLHEHLALAQVAVDPKNSDAGEGSGKMLNYLANALPVLAFDTINNAEFLGPAARLSKDVNGMSQLLLEYADNPSLLEEISRQNLQRFNATYSWNVAQLQLRGAYESLDIAISNTSGDAGPTEHSSGETAPAIAAASVSAAATEHGARSE